MTVYLNGLRDTMDDLVSSSFINFLNCRLDFSPPAPSLMENIYCWPCDGMKERAGC